MLLNKRFEFNNKPHLVLNNKQIRNIKNFKFEIKNLNNNKYEKLSCLICSKNNFEIINIVDKEMSLYNFAVRKKVDFWLCCYASSGMDVHGGVTSLSGMPKSIIAMNEIKQVAKEMNASLKKG